MLGSSCYCLSLGFVVVKRSFCSGGNQEEGPACLYSYLISSLLPKSISSQLLHCVTSLPFGSVWEREAWRQKEGKKRDKPTRIPAKCLPLPLALCAQGKQSQLCATCLCPGGTLLLLGLCAVLGQLPPRMGTSPLSPLQSTGVEEPLLWHWGRNGPGLAARAGA